MDLGKFGRPNAADAAGMEPDGRQEEV